MGHLTEGLLTLRNLTGDAGEKNIKKNTNIVWQGGDHPLPDRSGAHLWSRPATFYPPRTGVFLPYGPPFFDRAGPPEILG